MLLIISVGHRRLHHHETVCEHLRRNLSEEDKPHHHLVAKERRHRHPRLEIVCLRLHQEEDQYVILMVQVGYFYLYGFMLLAMSKINIMAIAYWAMRLCSLCIYKGIANVHWSWWIVSLSLRFVNNHYVILGFLTEYAYLI